MPKQLKDLPALVDGLKNTYFKRWMAKAQKAALLEWRDRVDPPGLMARFTEAGAKFYQFSERKPFYEQRKGYKPDFVRTGGLRGQMSKREPHAAYGDDGKVTTKIKYGGGALNFLTNRYGSTATSVSFRAIVVTVKAYHRQFRGTQVNVSSYRQRRKVKAREYTKSSDSYADEFGRFVKDQPWIEERTTEIFLDIFASVALDKHGELRERYLSEMTV